MDDDASSGSGMSPAAAGEEGASDNAGEGMGDYGGGTEDTAPDLSFSQVASMMDVDMDFDTVFNDWDVMDEAYMADYEEAQMVANYLNLGSLPTPDETTPFMQDPVAYLTEKAVSLVDPTEYIVDVPNMRVGVYDNSPVSTVASLFAGPFGVQAGTLTTTTGEQFGYGQLSVAGFGLGWGETSQPDMNTDSTGGNEGSYQSGMQDYTKTVQSAGGAQQSKLLRSFMTSNQAAISPFEPAGSSYSSNYRSSSQLFAAGGQVDSMLDTPLPTDVDHVAVRQNPDAFLRDPEAATTAEELDAIYQYNRGIIELSKRPIRAQTGMLVGDQPPPQQAAPGGPTGVIGGTPPEQLPDGVKVADDVPMDVPEGSFVINAAAVEFAGSADIEKMIADAMKIAKQKGIDISPDGNTIDPKEYANLLVSRGEVVISPALAQIIGYDRLEKINNRGKKETEQRIAENGQAPAPQEAPQQVALGDRIEQHATREPQAILHQASASSGRDSAQGFLSAELEGDGYKAKADANYANKSTSQEYPDGVVVDSENKNLGFALNGELYLFDDTWIHGGVEKQKGKTQGTANTPTGESVAFGEGYNMTRYNLGATFGDLDVDLSGLKGEGVDRGRVQYKLNKSGDTLFIEGDKTGNISTGLRLNF